MGNEKIKMSVSAQKSLIDRAVAQLCLWSVVYQRWQCCKYTCAITAEKNNWVAIAL